MDYLIIDAPSLPRGLTAGDQRYLQRPVVTAMAKQIGLPPHRWLHPVGQGLHYTARADYDEADEFFSDAFTLPEPPSIEALPAVAEPDAREAAHALKKTEGALKIALADLLAARSSLRQAQLAVIVQDDNESSASLVAAEKLHRVRRDRLHRRQIERLEAEQAHQIATTRDDAPSLELRRCAAELRQLAAIANERDLWSLMTLPDKDHGRAVFNAGPGGAKTISRLREVLEQFLRLTDRESVPVTRAIYQPDIALLITQPTEQESIS